MSAWWDKIIESRVSRGELQPGWRPVSLSWLGGDDPKHWTHMAIVGAVYPPIQRGPRKGRPNYKKPQPGTQRTLILTADEVRDG